MTQRWQIPSSLAETARSIAEEHGTPFFLFDEGMVEETLETFRRTLEPVPHRIEYSVKTNREWRVVDRVRNAGFGVEVTGAWELEWATRCGFDPASITIDGPIKPTELLEAGLAAGVSRFHVDSPAELAELSRLATERGVEARILLRLAIRSSLFSGPSIAESAIGRFGFTPDQVDEAGEAIAAGRLPGIRFEGVAFFLGSQVLSTRPFVRRLAWAGKLLQRLRRRGVDGREINAGGGFPTPALAKTSVGNALRRFLGLAHAPVPELASTLTALREAFERLPRPDGPPLILGVQPGRCLVGSAAILVGTVREVKGRWVFLDASHDYLPETLLFAQREAAHLDETDGRPRRRFHLAGRTIAASDVFVLNQPMPEPRVGDRIALADAGAYSIVRASRSIALTPPAYWRDRDGRVGLLRRAETVDDAMATTVIPPREG